MKIYKNEEELNFENIHLTEFELSFNKLVQLLPNMIEMDFSSIQSLKGQNKDLLELAFNAEFHQSY